MSPILVGPKMESEIKKWDSPVKKSPQRDEQKGANIPLVASTIKRLLHLEQKKPSGPSRTRLLREKKKATGQANTDTGSKQRPEQTASTSEGQTGAGSGTSKRTRNSSVTPTSTEKQPTKRCRTLPEVSYRHAASNLMMAIIRKKYPEDKLVEEDIKDIQSEILRIVDGAKPGEPLPLLRTYSLQDGA